MLTANGKKVENVETSIVATLKSRMNDEKEMKGYIQSVVN